MNTFCMLAYIPSIILIIWLFVEVRKFVMVSKDLRQTEAAWEKLERHRQQQQAKEKSVETISPPPPPDYYPEERSDQYDYDYDPTLYPPAARSRSRSRSSYRTTPRRGTPPSRRKGRRPRGKRRVPPPGRPRKRSAKDRSRKKPLARYDEELGYSKDNYDESEEVDWD